MNPWDVIFQILLVFAPHIGYVAQYFEIVSTNSIEGYASLVSLILLTSNTLRLYYYIGKRFMLALLFQSIVGVIVHFIVLLKVLDVHVNQVVSRHQEDVLFGLDAASPSQLGMPISVEEAGGKPAPAAAEAASQPFPSSSITDQADTILADEAGRATSPVAIAFLRILRFLFQVEDHVEQSLLNLTPRKFAVNYVGWACVAFVVVIFYYLSIGLLWHGAPSVVGYVSLGIEALLVLPQILRNARRRSTEGLSIILILTWVVGDVIKVVYYAYKKQELPFIVCGVFQILLDVVVIAQFVYYHFYLRLSSVANVREVSAPSAREFSF